MQIVTPVSEADFAGYYALRWKLLRSPWGQTRGSEKDDRDKNAIHVMVIDADNTIIGVGRLHLNNISEAQIRYMAVAVNQQRTGIGSRILQTLEDKALQLGASTVVLNARETALGFYTKHGYISTGPGHMLFNRIAHVRMVKRLGSRPAIRGGS